jgi:hypothetical protein
MAPKTEDPKKQKTLLGELGSKVIDLLTALRLVFVEVRDHLDDQVEFFLRRVEMLFFIYLWVSVGALFMVLGLFDLLIQYAGIPKPWVFSVGGLLILLSSVIFLQSSRLRRKHR